jgi:LPS-assembly lipoprotein
MLSTKIKIIFLLIICCSSVACGFRLRDESFIPPQLRTLYIQSNNPYGEFESTLKRTLRSLDVTLVPRPQAAPVTLQVQQTNLTYAPTSIGTSSQATVYNVTYTVVIALLDHTGAVLVPAQPISSTATMTLSANQVISNNNQLYLLSQQLQRDIITRMISIFGSQQVTHALESHKKR